MNQTMQNKDQANRTGKTPGGEHALSRFNEHDAASVVQRIRQEAAEHPYRTIGVAALAGMALSSPVGRALAGWAGMRVGWDILLAVLRDRSHAPAQGTG